MAKKDYGRQPHSHTPVILSPPGADDPTVAGTGTSYRVIRLLGRGTMSSVYLAEQVSMARPVALKILSQVLSSDPEFVERFLREARASARLNHRNIVAAFDFGEFQNRFFLAMEFIDGESLASLLARETALEETRVAGIGLQVIAALKHASRHNVIHLDVKPANIMICKDGTVKLADFGLAVILDNPGSAEASRKAVGTPYYMAPEQVEGGLLDWRTDQFSLGAGLYEAVTGLKPFTGKSVPDILMKRFFEKPEPAWRTGKRVGKGFSAVLAKMLSRSPDGRYASFIDLETDFNRILEGGKPVVARIESTSTSVPFGARWASLGSGNVGGRVGRMERRGRWNWVLYSSLLALALLAAYAFAYSARLAGPKPPAEVRRHFVAEAERLPEDVSAKARGMWTEAWRLMMEAEADPVPENIEAALASLRALAGERSLVETAYGTEARRCIAALMETLRARGEGEGAAARP